MKNVALDEQRHIAFGVRLLADLYRESPQQTQDAIIEEFRLVLPWSTCVAEIPGWDLSYTQSLGYDLEDIYEHGAQMSEARLRSIGLPVDEIPRFPLPLDLPPRERGARGIKLMRAGYLGPRHNYTGPDDEATQILFDQVARTAAPDVVPAGTTIEWSFTDAEPWHVVFDNGATRAVRGPAARPTASLRLSFDDFVDITADRADPRMLMLRRRVRPKGDPRVLLKLPKLFA
jgi:hypothetical protein